jgi:hypothetical protein
MLTRKAKPRYFLVQEVLNFFMTRSIAFSRPAGEKLFVGSDRTLKLLREVRKQELGIEPRDDEAFYPFSELEGYVNAFKARLPEASGEKAWLLLQFVMSAFRSQVTQDLGSREEVQTLAREPGSREQNQTPAT